MPAPPRLPSHIYMMREKCRPFPPKPYEYITYGLGASTSRRKLLLRKVFVHFRLSLARQQPQQFHPASHQSSEFSAAGFASICRCKSVSSCATGRWRRNPRQLSASSHVPSGSVSKRISKNRRRSLSSSVVATAAASDFRLPLKTRTGIRRCLAFPGRDEVIGSDFMR